jgi:L-serine dehydratase
MDTVQRDPAIESLSVFDMLKIGVGPSSSHTLGPWRAVQRWLSELAEELAAESLGLHDVEHIRVHLYGSLALTGKGHATDQAIALALLGHQPETVDVAAIAAHVHGLARAGTIELIPGYTARFAVAGARERHDL